jgi:hypothetical protein
LIASAASVTLGPLRQRHPAFLPQLEDQMNARRSPATPSGGRSASELDESLEATLSHVSVADLVDAGCTLDELARSLASTPPFSEALRQRVRGHLLTIVGR